MKKFILGLSKFILVIAFLNIFAFSVLHVFKGGSRLGIFTNAIKEFSEFPNLVEEVLKNSKNSPLFLKTNPDFHTLNNLSYDVFAMNGLYDNSKWIISLTNLKNDSIVNSWHLDEKDFLYENTDHIFSHARPVSPLLLEDKSIIIQCLNSPNLYRLDKQSKIMWHNTDHLFHHSINLDKEENIWICTRKTVEFPQIKNVTYNDDYITKIDVENGNTLYNKSISEILIDNELSYLVYGLTNHYQLNSIDPIHLNDIEPVLENGPYWKSGDLFLSFRHRSMILLFRPSTNKILRVIQGPFFCQHDVDLQSDSTITLFNNNTSNLVPINHMNPTNDTIGELQHNPIKALNKNSQVLIYDLSDSTFSTVYSNQFVENKIFTKTEGLHRILSNGDMFVESQNDGKVYIFNENEVLLKKYLNPVKDKQVQMPNWVRIYEKINF